MTIVFKGRVLLFAEPTYEDSKLVAHVQATHAQWVKDGRPESGLGF